MCEESPMPVSPANLPDAKPGTKRHLFDLVTNSTYRDKHSNMAYEFVPTADGGPGKKGPGGKKWGYSATLACGTEQAQAKTPYVDPGRHRIFRWMQGDKPTWWLATHTPSNTYKFIKITLPKCRPCNGTAEIICPTCRGTRRQQIGNSPMTGPCPTCAKRPAPVLPCPACTPSPVIADGYSIDKSFANW
jgi:hypothetical protein